MMEVKISNDLCRICLYNDSLIPIFTSNIRDETLNKLQACVSVSIDENDPLPKNICEKCLLALEVAYLFRCRCEQTDAELRNLIVNQEQLLNNQTTAQNNALKVSIQMSIHPSPEPLFNELQFNNIEFLRNCEDDADEEKHYDVTATEETVEEHSIDEQTVEEQTVETEVSSVYDEKIVEQNVETEQVAEEVHDESIVATKTEIDDFEAQIDSLKTTAPNVIRNCGPDCSGRADHNCETLLVVKQRADDTEQTDKAQDAAEELLKADEPAQDPSNKFVVIRKSFVKNGKFFVTLGKYDEGGTSEDAALPVVLKKGSQMTAGKYAPVAPEEYMNILQNSSAQNNESNQDFRERQPPDNTGPPRSDESRPHTELGFHEIASSPPPDDPSGLNGYVSNFEGAQHAPETLFVKTEVPEAASFIIAETSLSPVSDIHRVQEEVVESEIVQAHYSRRDDLSSCSDYENSRPETKRKRVSFGARGQHNPNSPKGVSYLKSGNKLSPSKVVKTRRKKGIRFPTIDQMNMSSQFEFMQNPTSAHVLASNQLNRVLQTSPTPSKQSRIIRRSRVERIYSKDYADADDDDEPESSSEPDTRRRDKRSKVFVEKTSSSRRRKNTISDDLAIIKSAEFDARKSEYKDDPDDKKFDDYLTMENSVGNLDNYQATVGRRTAIKLKKPQKRSFSESQSFDKVASPKRKSRRTRGLSAEFKSDRSSSDTSTDNEQNDRSNRYSTDIKEEDKDYIKEEIVQYEGMVYPNNDVQQEEYVFGNSETSDDDDDDDDDGGGDKLTKKNRLMVKITGKALSKKKRRFVFNEMNSLSCDVCGKMFPYKSHLIRHVRTHTSIKPFTCQCCNKNFRSRSSLTVHVKNMMGVYTLRCKVCKRGFVQRSVLERHMFSHSGEHNYKCEICFKTFTYSSSLNLHRRMHAVKEPQYKCDICHKLFRYSNTLRSHLRQHSGIKPYSCPECHKSFFRQGLLKRHMRSHTKERPYKCKVCKARFAYSGGVASHMKLHTGIRPYKCTMCDNSFFRNSHLQNHFNVIHNSGVLMTCKKCAMEFNNRYLYKAHTCGSGAEHDVDDVKEEDEHMLDDDELDDDQEGDVDDGDV